MATYTDLFLNQFFVTLGQVTAVTVSASFLVPMYQYYSVKLKKLFINNDGTPHFEENFQDDSELVTDDSADEDVSVVDGSYIHTQSNTQSNNNQISEQTNKDL